MSVITCMDILFFNHSHLIFGCVFFFGEYDWK